MVNKGVVNNFHPTFFKFLTAAIGKPAVEIQPMQTAYLIQFTSTLVKNQAKNPRTVPVVLPLTISISLRLLLKQLYPQPPPPASASP